MKIILLLILTLLAGNTYAEVVNDPCTSLLALVNRPSAADAACVIPYKHVEVEMGYQNQNQLASGRGYNIPQASFRLGLPGNNELFTLLPNYNHQTASPTAGFSAPVIGFKHEIGYTSDWLGAVDGRLTLPTGSSAYGSDGLGAVINGIVTYSINTALSITFMLGVASQPQSYTSGGQRINSVNPDLLLSWQFDDTKSAYGEVFGQSKTGPGQGAGFNADAGMLYLLKKNLELDISVGQRISGQLSSYSNYIGAGFSVLF